MTQAEWIIALITGLTGVIGGLYYIWHMRQSRTIIRVEPYVSMSPSEDQYATVGIKVINESHHAVTLTEMGVLFSNTEQRMITHRPLSQDNKPLPCRIEPHSSFEGTFESGLYRTEPNIVFATHVFAQLSDGKIYKKEIHFNPVKEHTGVPA
jgi:hypothetical protein